MISLLSPYQKKIEDNLLCNLPTEIIQRIIEEGINPEDVSTYQSALINKKIYFLCVSTILNTYSKAINTLDTCSELREKPIELSIPKIRAFFKIADLLDSLNYVNSCKKLAVINDSLLKDFSFSNSVLFFTFWNYRIRYTYKIPSDQTNAVCDEIICQIQSIMNDHLHLMNKRNQKRIINFFSNKSLPLMAMFSHLFAGSYYDVVGFRFIACSVNLPPSIKNESVHQKWLDARGLNLEEQKKREEQLREARYNDY